MPHEDKNFRGSFSFDFGIWWRHLKTILSVVPQTSKPFLISRNWPIWRQYCQSVWFQKADLFELVAVFIIIFVFKIQSGWTHLKWTCLFLINLAVADLLVHGSRTSCSPGGPLNSKNWNKILSLPWAMQAFSLCNSVMFLALISLERIYALLWPLCTFSSFGFHRTVFVSSPSTLGYRRYLLLPLLICYSSSLWQSHQGLSRDWH